MSARSIALAALVLYSPLPGQSHPGQVIRSIRCPAPCPTGLAARGDRLWVVDRFTDKIYELDRATGKVRRELEAPCYQPTGLTMDEEGKLWVGSDMPDLAHDKLYRLDPDSEEVIAIVPSPRKRLTLFI